MLPTTITTCYSCLHPLSPFKKYSDKNSKIHLYRRITPKGFIGLNFDKKPITLHTLKK